jgi:hypothetical protein
LLYWYKRTNTDKDGVAQIRGDAIFGNDGSVRIKTLDFHIVADVQQLQQSVSKALASRVSGNSTLHAQVRGLLALPVKTYKYRRSGRYAVKPFPRAD